MTSYDVKSYDLTNEIILYVYFVGEASTRKWCRLTPWPNMECIQRRWTKGVNTFERVQNSELSEKITKIKLRKSQKIKLHVTSFEFISFWVIVVSSFLFICHKSHTTMETLLVEKRFFLTENIEKPNRDFSRTRRPLNNEVDSIFRRKLFFYGMIWGSKVTNAL